MYVPRLPASNPLADHKASSKELGAAPLQAFLGGEEIFTKIEHLLRTVCLEPYPMLPRNVGETLGDIGPATEYDAFEFCADCCQSGTHIVAAIEKGGTAYLGNRLAGGGDKRLEPARPYIAPGIRRAREGY